MAVNSSEIMSPVVEPVTEPVTLGEGPHWDEDDQALYFISIYDHTVNKYVPDTKRHTKSKLSDKTSFIIPIEGKPEHFIVGMNRAIVEIQWDGNDDTARVLRTVAEIDNPLFRFNDGKADPRGRLFVGTLAEWSENPPKGSLYRIDPDGSMHEVISEVNGSNGLCWDLEEEAFYYIASYDFNLKKYKYDVENGTMSNPRVVYDLKEQGLEGVFDGMTIDTDGNLWIANFYGSQVIHINPRASPPTLIQTIPIPALQTTSATFGSNDRSILYVTSAKIELEGKQPPPPAGATFKVTGLMVTGAKDYKVQMN